MGLVSRINIETSIEELSEVCDLFEELTPYVSNDRKAKAFRSGLDIAIDKMLKKQVVKRHTSSRFKITLEFVEAHFLEQWLVYFANVESTSATQRFIDKLNQKLV